MSRCGGIVLRVVGTVVGDHEHIEGRDPPFLGEADFHAALETGPRASDEMFLFAADAHHHRSIGFFREQRRNNRENIAGRLAAETAAGVLADEHNLVGIHIQPASQASQRLHRTLRSHVNENFAVLPISQGGARLQRLMTGVRRNKCFIENQCGILEPGIYIAKGPLVLVRRCASRCET